MPDDDSARLRSDILSLAAAAEGIAIPQLATLLDAYFASDRSEAELNGYRLSQRPFKKLREEIVPVSQFLTARGLPGRVRFPLDSNIPDAWYLPDGADPVGIEVTTALGRAANAVSEQLIEEGVSGGPLGWLPNTASRDVYAATRRRGRVTLISAQRTDALQAAISERIADKAGKPDYQGMVLLITARISRTPSETCRSILANVAANTNDTPFSEIWLIDMEGRETRLFSVTA